MFTADLSYTLVEKLYTYNLISFSEFEARSLIVVWIISMYHEFMTPKRAGRVNTPDIMVQLKNNI